jgi:tetratricopeptide (TPR) repeat protein
LGILPIALRNHYVKETKQILRGVALAFTYKANYDLGLRYNFELLKATEQDNDSIEMSYVLSNIGLIYYKLANPEKALHYYLRALDVRSPLDKFPRTSTFVNISLCYSVLKDFPRARAFLKKGEESCQPQCERLMVEVLQAYGALYFRKGDLDSAEVYFLKSYSLAKQSGNKRYQLSLITSLTTIYLARDQISLALPYLSEAESLMQQSPFARELIYLYVKFFSFYKKTGDSKRTAFYQGKCIQLLDSIYSPQLTNNLMKIESDHLAMASRTKILEQEQLLALKDQVIKRQNTFNLMIGITTVLLLALLYVLHRSNRQRKSVNRVLDQKVKERTAELESNYLAFKKSFEENDITLNRTFADIKDSTSTIKELCTIGLMDSRDGEIRKCLSEISIVMQHVSLKLGRIQRQK